MHTFFEKKSANAKIIHAEIKNKAIYAKKTKNGINNIKMSHIIE